MNDLFAQKNIKPMLIGAEGEAFDSPDYLYKLKLDGALHCISWTDSCNRISKQTKYENANEGTGTERHS